MALSGFFSHLLDRHPGLEPWIDRACDIEPLTSPSGHSWRVESARGVYVLRVPGRLPPGADWEAEAAALEVLPGAELIPAPLYQDPRTGVLLRPWVEGNIPEEKDDPGRPVALLARAHRIRLEGMRVMNLSLAPLSELPLPGALRVARRFHPLPPLAEVAFCHNDPHPGNFILGPRRDWLLDWEYVGLGDPLRDLAYFAAWDPGPLDPPWWLNLYGTSIEEGAVARFEFGVAFADAVSCWWWHRTGGDVPRWRWERLREAVSSPRWTGTCRLAGIPPTQTAPPLR